MAAAEEKNDCLVEPDIATYFPANEMNFDKLRAYAGLAEEAERHEDEMIYFVKELVKLRLKELGKCSTAEEKKKIAGDEGPLGLEVRNVFSVAFKTTVGERRTAWRQLEGGEANSAHDLKRYKDDESDPENKKKIAALNAMSKFRAPFKKVIYEEIVKHCTELCDYAGKLADEAEKMDLDPSVDAWVFYTKMKADYLRYQCEVTPNLNENDDKKLLEMCEKNYKDAYERAKKDFKSTNSTRLGLALNFSVCKYEILNDKEGAKDLAKEAFDEAINQLQDVEASNNKDSTLIMQLLRDNLTLWSPNNAVQDDDQ